MPQFQVFRWREGRGWFVLTGGADREGEIRGRALGLAAADGGVACVVLDEDPEAVDLLLDDIKGLGGQPGYVVDVRAEDDETLRLRLTEASVIVISANIEPAAVKSILMGAALEGIEAAFDNGAVILVEAAAIQAFGELLLDERGRKTSAFGWLERAFVMPTDEAFEETARQVLMQEPDALALAVPYGSAVAFGPDGEVELWGQRQVKILLGNAAR